MHQPDLLEIFISPLEAGGFNYFITGSVASTLYGEPRLTHDIDLVIMLKVTEITTFIHAFPDSDFYCPPSEVIRVELARKMFAHFNLIHHDTGYKADVYPFTGNALHSWAFKKKERIEFNAKLKFWVAPPEYVIIRKLQYYREGGSEKHLSDIKKMVIAQGSKIQTKDLQQWIEHFGLHREWELARTFREIT